ncbi:MAG: DUF1127 domain-containing protein [Pseudomonadota bacterium]
MAHIALPAHDGFLAKVFAPITSFFHILAAAQVASASTDARLHEIERLQALSDGKLAEMGLKRDEITRHVFRDIYNV